MDAITDSAPGAAAPDARRRSRLSIALLILGLVAGAALIYLETRPQVPDADDNARTFCSFERGLDVYKRSLRREWLPRLFSNYLASVAVHCDYDEQVRVVDGERHRFVGSALDWPELSRDVALWTAGWLLLTGLVLTGFWRRRTWLWLGLLGLGVGFGYLPSVTTSLYPWDMPALFCFTVGITLIRGGRTGWLLLLIPVAVGFKETSPILAVAFLFWDAPWRKRLLYLAGCALLSVAVKLVIDWVTGNPAPLLSMTAGDDLNLLHPGGLRLWRNLRLIASLTWPHPLLINGGTLVLLLLLPLRDPRIAMLKIMCGLFCLGILFFGRIVEYRIWFEMIPVSLYGIELFLAAREVRSAPAATGLISDR